MSLPLRQEDWEAPLRLSAPKRLQHRRAVGYRRRVRAALTLLVCLFVCGLAAWGWQTVRALEAASGLRLAATVFPKARVALQSATAERRLGFVTITGSVANHASKSLPAVEAVAELLDSGGRTIGMESAMIAFDPLPAGEPSPFRVEMIDNARAVAYRVRFRQISGSALN